MDENKKVVVNLPEGTTQAEIIVREGEAPAVLAPKPPVKIDLSGVIGAPVEFLGLTPAKVGNLTSWGSSSK